MKNDFQRLSDFCKVKGSRGTHGESRGYLLPDVDQMLTTDPLDLKSSGTEEAAG